MAQHAQQQPALEPDRPAGWSYLREQGFGYFLDQIKNTQTASDILENAKVRRRHQAHVNYFKQQLDTISTRLHDWYYQNKLIDHRGFGTVHTGQIELYTNPPADEEGHTINIEFVEDIQNEVLPEMRQLSRYMNQPGQLPILREVGVSIRLIANNIQWCFHAFNSAHFAPGDPDATKDYPHGPQTPLMRTLIDLRTDFNTFEDSVEQSALMDNEEQMWTNVDEANGALKMVDDCVKARNMIGARAAVNQLNQRWSLIERFITEQHYDWSPDEREALGNLMSNFRRLNQLVPA